MQSETHCDAGRF